MAEQDLHLCHSCTRPFNQVFDYPRIEIKAVEVFDEPRVVSGIAFRNGSWDDISQEDADRAWDDVKDISELVETLDFLGCLMEKSGDRGISPKDLCPKLDASPRFKWKFPLPAKPLTAEQNYNNTLALLSGGSKIVKARALAEQHGLGVKDAMKVVDANPEPFWVCSDNYYLGLPDEEPPTEDQGVCHLTLYTDGPNMGSAGGPTILTLAQLAKITYKGQVFH